MEKGYFMSEMLEAKTTCFSVWMNPFRSTRKCAAFSVQKIPFKEFSCILKFQTNRGLKSTVKFKEFFDPNMAREELIGYCDLHSETERALFHKSMIAQIVEYVGCPEDYTSPEEILKGKQDIYSMHEPMKILVDLARKNNRLNNSPSLKIKENKR